MEDNRIPDFNELSDIPHPQFEIGTKVRWNSIAGDRGVITGMRYVWNEDIQNWQYQYYIALNLDSPSYEWTKFDWGWQEDLEALFFPDSQTSDRTKEESND